MTDRAINFTAPMVRALISGTKTQTRQVLKPQPADLGGDCWHIENRHGGDFGVPTEEMGRVGPDYVLIKPGDRLWLREKWALKGERDPMYAADWKRLAVEGLKPWRPSIHMPRWASRLTLIVTDVRVERLQDISEADARAEGAPPFTGALQSYRTSFFGIWTSIHGPDSWAANPWVAVLSFEVHRCNIDAMPAKADDGWTDWPATAATDKVDA